MCRLAAVQHAAACLGTSGANRASELALMAGRMRAVAVRAPSSAHAAAAVGRPQSWRRREGEQPLMHGEHLAVAAPCMRRG
eukprot:scaffold13153_cov103-Isochrysis_galbana.AAC.3